MTKKQDTEALADKLKHFVDEWKCGRFSGDNIYSMHMGTEREAELTVTLLEGAITALRSQPVEGWLPIETHKNHFPVLVGCPPSKGLAGRWAAAFLDVTNVWRVLYSEGGMTQLQFTPTHWQPLPTPPAQGDEQEPKGNTDVPHLSHDNEAIQGLDEELSTRKENQDD